MYNGNYSYNSLQVTVEQRMAYGLTFNFNYTWSKNIGDDGTFRSGFAIPAAAIDGGTQDWKMDRIERSVTVISSPHVFHAYGTYNLPFGKGELGGQHLVTRQLFGGWQLSGIWTYSSGTPVAVIASNCTTANSSSANLPLQGQCMPSIAPGATAGTARNPYGYGRDASGKRSSCALGLGTGCKATQYLNPAAFQYASTFTGSPILKIGNAPRTRAFGMTNPAQLNFDASVRRTFPIHDSINIQLEATASNVLNHTNFSNPNATYNGPNPTPGPIPVNGATTSYGTITSVSNTPRAFQFAGHINF